MINLRQVNVYYVCMRENLMSYGHISPEDTKFS